MKLRVESAAILAWVSLTVGACLLVAVSLLPYSPLRSSFSFLDEESVTKIVPQGWGFFTKDPQEVRVHYFSQVDDGSWINADIANSDSENLFGASRVARLRGIEYGTLISENQTRIANGWSSCSAAELQECARRTGEIKPIPVENSYPVQTLCGRIVVLQQAPNAWAYHQFGFENGNPIETLSLDIDCV